MILQPLLESHGIFLGDKSPLDIELIALRLANINRFNGQVGSYSVAQHSIVVAEKLPEKLKLSGLLHDAAEAYIGDVIGPVKAVLPKLVEVENAILDEVDREFGVDTRHKLVHTVDTRMLITEAKYFGIWTGQGWPKGIARYRDVTFYNSLHPEMARLQFLDHYRDLR